MAEVERKWLLAGLPPTEIIGEGILIIQGYVFTEPEMRIRRKSGRCFLTVKGDRNISRDEWEAEIPDWVFETLWPKTEGQRVEKTRYAIQQGDLVLELDVYHGSLAGLVTLECEFPDEEVAWTFTLPEWAKSARASEVTAYAEFKNKNLSVHGLPKQSSFEDYYRWVEDHLRQIRAPSTEVPPEPLPTRLYRESVEDWQKKQGG